MRVSDYWKFRSCESRKNFHFFVTPPPSAHPTFYFVISLLGGCKAKFFNSWSHGLVQPHEAPHQARSQRCSAAAANCRLLLLIGLLHVSGRRRPAFRLKSHHPARV